MPNIPNQNQTLSAWFSCTAMARIQERVQEFLKVPFMCWPSAQVGSTWAEEAQLLSRDLLYTAVLRPWKWPPPSFRSSLENYSDGANSFL